jgi:ketosteroid isomerase-like protein
MTHLSPGSENQNTVDRYMEGFRRNDHRQILACLTDDVEWILPGAFHVHGKDSFDKQIEAEGFVPPPSIDVTRMLEVDNVVFAEGFVQANRSNGTVLKLAMCDVLEMRGGRIRRLTSYIMPTP